MEQKRKRGTTFLEIVFAVAILAIAMVPLFGLMSRQTVETDKNASQAFAMNKASEVLDTILDNVPFVAIRQGNPGIIKVSDLPKTSKYSKYNEKWAKKIANMLFHEPKKEGGGWTCRGVCKDARGISYLIHLRVEDLPAPANSGKPEKKQIGTSFPDGKPSSFSPVKDLTFSYLKNPSIISDGNWFENYRRAVEHCSGGACSIDDQYPFCELDLAGGNRGVAEPKENVYLDEGTEIDGAGAFKFKNPTAIRYSQHTVVNKLPYPASEPYSHSSMKKLLVQVQWNLDAKYFNNPEKKAGRIQKIHLVTIKGDID